MQLGQPPLDTLMTWNQIAIPSREKQISHPWSLHQIINDTLLPWKANIPTIMMKSPWQQPILPFQRRLHLIKCCKTVADTFMIIAQQQKQKNHIKRGILKVYKPTAVVDEKLILVLATALSASLLFDHYVRKTFVYYSKGAGGQNTHKL